MIRINKFLAQAGIASRRKCDELIKNGKITINGKVETSLGRVIDEKRDKVTFEGNPVVQKQFVYLKMHKPKGYMCSAKDDRGRKTVYDLLPPMTERVFTIGRLDYDTEGLLLFTNDGDLAERISHPRYEVEKVYIAKVSGTIKESDLAVLRKGVVVEGEVLPESKVEFVSSEKGSTKIQITIDEGKNHQIKKMIAAIGKELLLLKRVQIGRITLGGLSRGETKKLTFEETQDLLTM